MNQPWTTWLLGGALVASLAWNLRWTGAEGGGDRPVPEGCARTLDLSGLELDANQRRELERWRESACYSSCRADETAQTKIEELQAALRDPSVPAERLHQLAAEVGRLRAESLDECVDSIVAVRRVLTAEQLGALMNQCCGAAGCAK